MLGAFARAYAVLGEEKYRAAAEKNLAFLQAKLWVSGLGAPSSRASSALSGPAGEDAGAHRLYHRWRDGERDQAQLLEDYAFLLSGVIELYEATLEPSHLDFAISLAEAMLAKFYDQENGGFWQSPPDAKNLILKVKEDYDGAEPSGNSVAILALLKLGKITDRKEFSNPAENSLRLFAQRLHQIPRAVPFMLQDLDFSLEEPKRAVIAGDPGRAETKSLIHATHSVYQPNKVVLGNAGAVDPFAKTLQATNGPVVYLCTGTACLPPTSDAQKLHTMMK
jgi:uncharacterized protein YyaL (SSP411 family)